MSGGIYGWGYEGRTVSDLVDYCMRVHATLVIDVRLNAISRKPGFSKTALRNALNHQGLEYVHLRGLGNPKDNRPGFAHPGSVEASRAHKRFVNEVLDGDQGDSQVESVLEMLETHTIVFICFESSPDCCHRSLVMRRVQERLGAKIESVDSILK